MLLSPVGSTPFRKENSPCGSFFAFVPGILYEKKKRGSLFCERPYPLRGLADPLISLYIKLNGYKQIPVPEIKTGQEE
jgi:hypothetical protein